MPLGMVETDIVTKLLDFIPDATRNTVNLAYADIIVAGGKGLKNADNFKLVWDLARVLGAEVGATRAVTQAGWLEAERQVGQTGKTVRPKLYIAAGCQRRHPAPRGHGGVRRHRGHQHRPNAPIFDFAHHGIVGNAMQVLPADRGLPVAPGQAHPQAGLSLTTGARTMSPREKFDAIVVGAGPSGNTAAYTLAKAGLKVLQIERGEYPGSKNVQGAILYADALERVIPDFRDDAPLERHVIEQRVWVLDDNSFVGTHYRSDDYNKPPYNRYTIIRAQFDKWFSKVREAGALLICETTVEELLMDGKRCIGVRCDRQGGEVHADVVILADGVNSTLARKAGCTARSRPATWRWRSRRSSSCPKR
jgi:hypothetical protein